MAVRRSSRTRRAVARCVVVALAATLPPVVVPAGAAAQAAAGAPAPGEVVTSWVANSFGGGPPTDPDSDWVQQDVCAMAVAADGTVYAHSRFDEGGRETGVYHNGAVVGMLGGNHSFQRRGGCAIALGSGEAFIAMEQGHHASLDESPPPGTTWFAIRRYSTVTRRANPFAGGDGYDDSMRIVGTAGPVTGLAASATTVFAAIAAEDVVRAYAVPGLTPLHSFAVPDPGHMALAPDGSLWIVSGESVRHHAPTGELLGSIAVDRPTSVALAGDRLVVPTDGPRQQVLFLDAEGQEVEAAGVPGGMFAEPRGRPGPLRFNGVVAAAVDGRGNLYVANGLGGLGTDLRKHTRAEPGAPWAEKWQLLALVHVDTADVHPADDTVLYTSRDRFRLDRSRPPGRQWTWDAHLVDRMANPGDPRLLSGGQRRHDTPQAVVLGGRTFLFATSMNPWSPRFYRVEGDTSHPSTELAASGFAWHVDDNGDVWNASGTTVRRHPFLGLSAAGDPQYGPPVVDAPPAEFDAIQRIHYDAAADTLYLAGWTPEHPRPDAPETRKLIGREIVRYDGWALGNRTPRWRLVVPFHQAGPAFREQFTQISMDVAGEYVFTAEMAEGRIRAYRTADAVLVDEWLPGPEVGSFSGALDLPDALNAHLRANGTYEVFVEEVKLIKVMHYRWTPPVA